jgi:myo-inositol 2-dehydrogenase/D-chiro-inositol 1-dehydrogenase
MGAVRAEALRQSGHAKLLYAIDIDQSAVEAFAKRFDCAPLLIKDMATALGDARVDAVMISTTSSTHHSYIMAALAAKKAVFTEKPLALSSAETLECLELAEKNGLPLYCGFQRRSDAHFRKVKELMHATNSKPELIRITSRDAPAHNTAAYLASSGGIFFDSLIHGKNIAKPKH